MGTSSTTSFDLLPPSSGAPQPRLSVPAAGGLSEDVLLANIFWFIRLRWAVAAAFVVLETIALLGADRFLSLGLVVPSRWPWVLAAVLAVVNVSYYGWGLRLARASSAGDRQGSKSRLYVNLWAQIVVDLVVLTLVVHYVGSVETYIAFAFLFHIVLACIFLPAVASLAVTGLSAGLYVACVGLEYMGLLSPSPVLAGSTFRRHLEGVPLRFLVHVGSAVAIWMVVWYLVSHLAAGVRMRDEQLSLANERLLRFGREKTQHMLHTTHELKAPFAAMQSNVQLLLKGYCGELADPAREVITKIDVRSRKLSNQVQEMLQLANLKSEDARTRPRVSCDLVHLIRRAIDGLAPAAASRNVTITCALGPAEVVGVRGQLDMLLANVISNAVHYSFAGGLVEVRCHPGPDGATQVVVCDQGIGIPPEKVAHVFDEYYRTNEGARHNRMSTGLGLAIVKRIAEFHRIAMHIDSEVGKGTTVTLTFPAEDAWLSSSVGRALSSRRT